MRIYIPCTACLLEAAGTGDATGMYFRAYPVPFNDSGVYRTRCDRGHAETTLVTEPAPFELLAETATQALVDGYFRDAVTSFAAALERFREFYIRVIAITRKIDQAHFDQTWKKVAAQSERQYGWYSGLYLAETGSAPPPMSRWYDDTRNDIVHKGRIPTEADAIRFGQSVFDHLAPILLDLKLRHGESLEQLRHERWSAARKNLRAGEDATSSGTVWVVAWMTEGGKYERTFEDCISHRRVLERRRSELNRALLAAQLGVPDSAS